MMDLQQQRAVSLLQNSSSTVLATALPSHLPSSFHLSANSPSAAFTEPQLLVIALRGGGSSRNSSSTFSASLRPPAAIRHHGDCKQLALASPAGGRHGVCKQLQSRKLRGIRAAKSGSDAPDSSASTSSERANPQTQSHLELLERLTQNSTAASAEKEFKTIREQLSSQIEPEEQEVIIPLSNVEKEAPVKELTISQKRNIRRQDYLNKVSERNDVPFFATVAAVVLIPPICILAIAVAIGYVDLFP